MDHSALQQLTSDVEANLKINHSPTTEYSSREISNSVDGGEFPGL